MGELNAKYFSHELVKRVVVLAADKGPNEKTLAVSLLQQLGKDGLVTAGQLAMGFDRVARALPDLTLDCPGAPAFLDHVRTTLSA